MRQFLNTYLFEIRIAFRWLPPVGNAMNLLHFSSVVKIISVGFMSTTAPLQRHDFKLSKATSIRLVCGTFTTAMFLDTQKEMYCDCRQEK